MIGCIINENLYGLGMKQSGLNTSQHFPHDNDENHEKHPVKTGNIPGET